MNDTSLQQTTPPPETQEIQGRRDFLRSLGKWSGAAITAAVVGPFVAPPQAQAGAAWVNRRYGGGGAGWVNRGGGGAGWVNRAYGGGGAGWVNRAYGGGGWVNRHRHRHG